MATLELRYVNSFRNRKRKSDRVRFYFRRRGEKAIPLPGLPGSEEFMAVYQQALAALSEASTEIAASRTLPGTVNALVVSYYQSGAWLHALGDGSRQRHRGIIERFREKHGNKRVALLRRDHIEGMLVQIEKPYARRHWLKAVRALLKHAVPTMIRDNPAAGIRVVVPKTGGYHSWSDAEVAQFHATGRSARCRAWCSRSDSKPCRVASRSRGWAGSMSSEGAS
jgi:hypothetical protein